MSAGMLTWLALSVAFGLGWVMRHLTFRASKSIPESAVELAIENNQVQIIFG